MSPKSKKPNRRLPDASMPATDERLLADQQPAATSAAARAFARWIDEELHGLELRFADFVTPMSQRQLGR